MKLDSRIGGAYAGARCLVVSGTTGIGRGLALELARAGAASVTIAGRSEARGASCVEEMRELAGGKGRFVFVELDAFSLKQCAALAERINAEGEALDVLVVSQGMATTQGFTPVPETGLDQKLTLHYWGRVALARALAPSLAKSERGAKVLSVLSAGVHSAHAKWAEDPELKGAYSIKAAADCAGFYNDIAAEMLSREQPGVSFFHASPGFVNTSWGTELPTALRLCVRCLQPLGRSINTCGQKMLGGMAAAAVSGSGGWHLLNMDGKATASKTGLHDQAKESVWAHTLKVLGKGGSVQ